MKIAVFSTGDEVVEPGAARRETQVFDSNRIMLMAMLRRIGCIVSDLGIRRDDSAQIAEVLQAAARSNDLILSSGGVSTGEGDFVKAAVESVGTLVFWRIAMKPGRPVAMGVIDGTPFIGLPGNPVASFVTFARVARPAILALSGAQWSPPPALPVRAQFAYRKKPARREYVRVHLRTSRGWRARGREISARGGRAAILVGGYRRRGRAFRERHASRTGTDSGLFYICLSALSVPATRAERGISNET